jgi:hypothetical protein
MAVAGIAAIAGLLGAFLGGGFTLLATEQQIEAQAAQAQADYLRSERRAAYAGMIANEQTMSRLAEDLNVKIIASHIGSPSEFNPFKESSKLQPARARLRMANIEVQLVGSKAAAGISNRIWKSYELLMRELLSLSLGGVIPPADDQSDKSTTPEEYMSRIDMLREDFIQVTREDMGAKS